jgi:hypothetical protein
MFWYRILSLSQLGKFTMFSLSVSRNMSVGYSSTTIHLNISIWRALKYFILHYMSIYQEVKERIKSTIFWDTTPQSACHLLSCWLTVWPWRWRQCYSEMSVYFQRTILCYITEYSTLPNHCCENLKSTWRMGLKEMVQIKGSAFEWRLYTIKLSEHAKICVCKD